METAVTPQPIDVTKLTTEELEALLKERKQNESTQKFNKRKAYESIRADVLQKIRDRVTLATSAVKDLREYVTSETDAFKEVMFEYGAMRIDGQMSFTITDGDFKVEIKSNKVKKFDERADVAAANLVEFLRKWVLDSQKGTNDPMYQLAMTMIERNQQGDLDYKAISKLYDLEEQFNSEEYSRIMNLFKESNVVEGTATNYYFFEKNAAGVWRKIEPSFNRL